MRKLLENLKEILNFPLVMPLIFLIAGMLVMILAARDLATGNDEKYITKGGHNLSVAGVYIGLALTVVGGIWLAWITLFT